MGFCIGAIAELEEDCNDIWKGIYRELMGIKGIMGEKGSERGIMGEGEITQNPSSQNHPNQNHLNQNPLTPLNPFYPFDIEKLKFYPLDTTLPPIVQLKLRCKELNFMLHRIQESLLDKMQQEKTLPIKDKLRMQSFQKNNDEDAEKKLFQQYGFERLESGQVIKKKI